MTVIRHKQQQQQQPLYYPVVRRDSFESKIEELLRPVLKVDQDDGVSTQQLLDAKLQKKKILSEGLFNRQLQPSPLPPLPPASHNQSPTTTTTQHQANHLKRRCSTPNAATVRRKSADSVLVPEGRRNSKQHSKSVTFQLSSCNAVSECPPVPQVVCEDWSSNVAIRWV